MRLRLPELRLILLAVAMLALLAVFALAPTPIPLSNVAHAQSADPEPNIVNICDRTEQVRDAIRSSFPCDEVTHAWLSSIKELRLHDREITALTAEDFADLSNLTYLDLRRNYVRVLPEGVFDDLTNLEKLYLGSPFLREVPYDAFANSPNLEELDLYASSLTKAPAAWFAKRTSLKRVMLGGMKLTELPDDPFEGLSNLEFLDLGGNELTDLPDGTFDGLTSLEQLYLDDNPLTRASAVWFEDLSSLEELQITLNDLSAPPDNVFANLSSLKRLKLVSGTLFFDGVPETALSADWFEDLSHLEELHVYGYLSTLPDGVFANLTSLKELDLGFNHFTAPSADWFKGLSNLEVLDLGWNDLSELSAGWSEHLTKLKDLDLSVNAFSHLLADWFQGLDKLERLNLRHQGSVDLGSYPPKPRRTHLRQLPDRVFVNLPNLRELHLGDNSLSTLPANVFEGLSNLEDLELGGNSLDSLPPDVFEGLTKLELLGFFGNELTSLPDGLFDGLYNLSFVSFLYNPGVPFTFTAQLEAQGSGAFVVKVAQGAPLPMEVTLSTEDGILSRDTITLTSGRVTSDTITVTTDDAYAGQVQINVTSAVFDGVHAWRGLNAAAGQPLYVNAPPAGSNAPAAGAPTISGTAQVGETLTADTSGIGDADGLSGTTFSYQWLSSRDTEIQGATDATYTLVAADAGKTIKVRVTFTDDAGHEETLTSAATAPVAAAVPPAPGPAVAVELSPSGSVDEGTEIALTMSFANLESDSDTSTTDYIFRADVVNADACEGGGMGLDRYMYKVDEDPEVRAGTVSASCAPGDYTVEVSISSLGSVELASATADFTVAAPGRQQQPEPLSTDATLSGLAFSNVDFGAFDSATTGYTASVANDVDETTVTPTTNDDGATYEIKMGGVADADGIISLSVGSNVITIKVTAEDGNTIKTYTITVTRATPPAPRPAVAVELSPSGSVDEGTEIALTMSFANLESDSDTSTTDYIFRADVVNADACEGGGMGKDRYIFKVDEDPEVRAATISAACPPGDYTVEVSISSPADVELASATVDFTVSNPAQQQEQTEPPSTDATLSGLTLSDVPFTFASDTTRYDVNVANGVYETMVTPTTNDAGATYVVKLGGVADVDGVIPLAVGGNVVTIKVTAEDGETTRTYTVTVTRPGPPLSADATLGSLALSDASFTFASDTTSYDVNVANGVDETTVTPTTNDDGASYAIKLGGVADDDGTVSLALGRNVITVEVTAEDGETTKTYTVTVVRAAPPSTDATLSNLALSNVDFGAFDSATAGYTASVANDADETTVTPTTNDDGATYDIKLGGVADDDGVIPLAVGKNVIAIEVTAEDGETTKTYTVTVTRAEAPAPEPTVAIELSSDSVEEGTEITVTMSFANLTPDNDANLVFRADVVGADGCEGQGIGVARNISKVDEDPEIRTGTIASACPVGDYILEVSLTDDDVELASARADFAVVEPDPTDEPKPTAPPDVPDAPTGEVTGKGQVRLDWNDVEGATYYQVRFYGNEGWVELPTDDISLVLDGSGATASNLPVYGFYYFAVRAGNAAGVSEWSDFLTLPNPEQ